MKGIRIPFRKSLGIALMPLVLGVAAGQSPQSDVEPLTFSVQTQLVQIYFTVTEGDRRITDLGVGDFTLTEDGTSLSIDRLDAGTVPLQIALLLDASESMREALPTVQQAAADFVDSLSPGDRISLITFNSDIRCVPQLNDDRSAILNAIKSTKARGSTRLYDAMLFAMKHLSGKEGRKAIVSFSDGEDTARSSSLNVALNAAERYGFPVYAIGAGTSLTRDPLKRVLKELSEVNSGRMFFVEDPRQLHQTFAEVLTELRSAYVISYYTQVPFDGRWHDLKVETTNPRHRVHSRKGFFARPGASTDLLSGTSESSRKPRDLVSELPDPPLRDPNAATAVEELIETPIPPRELDASSVQSDLPLATAAAPNGTAQKSATFKVESRFVEVPVLVESGPGKKAPDLAEKDFRVYEDGALREVAFFRKGVQADDIPRLRENAMKSAQPATRASFADPQELVLGRYYLVIDDLSSEASAYMSAVAAAEKIVREYHSPMRPLSLHFTSQSQAPIQPNENVEHMIRRLKENGSKADRELTNNDGLISVYEAYLIERGDTQARQLAELRYAASLMLQYRNDLGEVDGHNPAQTEMIQAGVQNISRSLLASNFAQVSRTVDGLKAVVNAAAADPGNYPKSILFLSSGFSLGRTSMRSDLSSLFTTAIETARRKGIKVFTVNSAGLEVQQALGIGASGAFLVRNPHLQSILETHAHSWRMDREEPLAQIATETGGRFLHSTNDLFGASADALRTAGDLYYLGFLSKQPVDGRFHRIRVVTSAAVKVHARKGFYAGHGTGSNMAALDGEDWETVLNSAEKARKSGDLKEYASGLEKLVRMFPNQANFWYNLGSVKMALNEPQDAVDALQKCFALMPEDKGVGAALSRALVAAGFRSAAVETLQMVAEKHPKDLDLLIQLGRIYEADSRTQDAYRAYRRVLDITLAPPLDVYVLLTRTSVRLGRGTEAGLFISDYLARGGQESSIDQWRNALTTSR